MCARTHPNLNLLKNLNKNRPPRLEPMAKHKRKRLGEIYISADRHDRLTLQASTLQTQSDEEVPFKTHCFSHLPNRSGPSVHLCWQFDDTHPAEEKSTELINAIRKIINILKSLDSDDDEFPSAACDYRVKTEVSNGHENGVPGGKAYDTKLPPRKEPQKEFRVGGDDFEGLESFANVKRDTNGTSTSRRKYRAYKAPASRFEFGTSNRKTGEQLRPSEGIEGCECRGRLSSTSDSGLQGIKSFCQPADDDEPEDVNVHDEDGSLTPEPTDDLITCGRQKEPEPGSESQGEFPDCEILDFDIDSTPRSRKLKVNDVTPDSDEEMNKTSLYTAKQGSEELESPNLSCHEFENKPDSTVNIEDITDEDKSEGSDHCGFGEPSREKHGSFTSGVEKEITATSTDVGKSRGEYFAQTENIRSTSSDSSDDGLLYEDEQMFHDSVREVKGINSKLQQVLSMHLTSGFSLSDDSRADHDTNAHDSEKRKEISRPRRRLRHETVTLPEVDRIFSGPNWKTFDSRVRVRTILDQFHYLVNFYRSEASTRERVKASRFRPDVLASKYLMAKRFCFNEGWSMVGNIPGVEVGDTFTYRGELLLLILHRTSQAGIEYIPAQKSGYVDKDGNPAAVAVSVVSSGGYKDTEDDGETLTYVGSGGERNLTNPRCSATDIRMDKDQELVRGNLALKNSCDLGVPVRVVRGEKHADGDVVKKCYWYDGLYDVMKYYEDVGSAGSKVWKFQLVKQKGQRES